MQFKAGAFSMAVKTKTPIVPLSIQNAHAIMPTNSIFPLQNGIQKLRIVVHRPIKVEEVKDDELEQLVRDKIIAGLEEDQRPAKNT